MRIERQYRTPDHKRQVKEDLRALDSSVVRDGPVCCSNCPNVKNIGCHRACPFIPTTLTSDPENEPLEPHISPLVFELKRLGVFEPCWSCEGHIDRLGKLWKLPAIWFYANSVIHIRLLDQVLQDLYGEHQLAVRWQIRVCYSDADNIGTTFAVEPRIAETPVPLSQLHADIAKISEQIEKRFLTRGRELLAFLL